MNTNFYEYISTNFRKTSKWLRWDSQGPGGNWFMKKTWRQKISCQTHCRKSGEFLSLLPYCWHLHIYFSSFLRKHKYFRPSTGPSLYGASAFPLMKSANRLPIVVKYGVRSLKFGLLYIAVLVGWNPATPPSPRHWGSYTRALLVSQDRRHLFVTSCAYLTLGGPGRAATPPYSF